MSVDSEKLTPFIVYLFSTILFHVLKLLSNGVIRKVYAHGAYCTKSNNPHGYNRKRYVKSSTSELMIEDPLLRQASSYTNSSGSGLVRGRLLGLWHLVT